MANKIGARKADQEQMNRTVAETFNVNEQPIGIWDVITDVKSVAEFDN